MLDVLEGTVFSPKNHWVLHRAPGVEKLPGSWIATCCYDPVGGPQRLSLVVAPEGISPGSLRRLQAMGESKPHGWGHGPFFRFTPVFRLNVGCWEQPRWSCASVFSFRLRVFGFSEQLHITYRFVHQVNYGWGMVELARAYEDCRLIDWLYWLIVINYHFIRLRGWQADRFGIIQSDWCMNRSK